jgi:hypothetical protein
MALKQVINFYAPVLAQNIRAAGAVGVQGASLEVSNRQILRSVLEENYDFNSQIFIEPHGHVLLFTMQYSRYAKGGNFGFSTPKALSNSSPRLELATTLGQTGSSKKR